MLRAAEFATTPAGYISGLLVPALIGALFAWLFMRLTKREETEISQESRLRKVEDAVSLLTYIVNRLDRKDRDNTGT